MRYLIAALLALAVASCSTAPKTVPISDRSPQHTATIARIASRHSTIVVRAGFSEPTYSLETNGGEVLVKDMTVGELAQKNPAMLDRVRNMQAKLLWAGE